MIKAAFVIVLCSDTIKILTFPNSSRGFSPLKGDGEGEDGDLTQAISKC